MFFKVLPKNFNLFTDFHNSLYYTTKSAIIKDMIWNEIRKFLLDLFFPKKCLGCGKSGTYLCPDCLRQIILNRRSEVSFGWIISAASYANPLTRNLIKTFKYHYVQELSEPLSQLMIKTLEPFGSMLRNQNFIIIPIPLHKYRLRYRGFNQAELLAKHIADYFNLTIETGALKRIISTDPQANIKNMEKRKNNLKNVFAVVAEAIKDKNILLVDDVCTTGATLIEAKEVLKLNNAKEIQAITVAKG